MRYLSGKSRISAYMYVKLHNDKRLSFGFMFSISMAYSKYVDEIQYLVIVPQKKESDSSVLLKSQM